MSTILDKILPRPSSERSTTAAAVSSQVVSMPRTIISASGPPFYRNGALKGALASRGNMTQSTAPLRIGTRGSPLALVQARTVRARLARRWASTRTAIELVIIRTVGRRDPGPAAGGGGRQGPVHQGDRGSAAGRPHRSGRAFGQGHADVLPAGPDAGGLSRARGPARRVHQPQGCARSPSCRRARRSAPPRCAGRRSPSARAAICAWRRCAAMWRRGCASSRPARSTPRSWRSPA